MSLDIRRGLARVVKTRKIDIYRQPIKSMVLKAAFGYEQEDGTVRYGTTFAEYTFEELIPYIQLKTVLYDVKLTKHAASAEEYFANSQYENENTMWRILYSLTGNAVCKANLMKGFLVLYPDEDSI
jgi:hypothetical protein